jgi:hypothetical protein
MALMKMVSIKIGRSWSVGANVIANVARYLGKIEVMRVSAMIAVVTWQSRATIIQKH